MDERLADGRWRAVTQDGQQVYEFIAGGEVGRYSDREGDVGETNGEVTRVFQVMVRRACEG